ncbi:VanZ family protein [Lysinibacter sp. HNR]|uniref:VanZ family protein n=1 Tax=Lysinibacter sp. HNR TaxID=3031408 RepID=UPI002434CDC7|nr:VanZ family protein [Lysinibacter sp. HNR]WGD37859.1 VanZ family protein [Lysinibacter sp. HNR]
MLHRHPILGFFTLAYLGFVGWITLGPQPLNHTGTTFIYRLLRSFEGYPLIDWVGYNELELIANIGMFIPVGLFFVLLVGRRLWYLAVLLSCLLTAGIEAAQVFIPERVSDPRDLIANSVGGAIGVLVGLVLTASKAKLVRLEKELANERQSSSQAVREILPEGSQTAQSISVQGVPTGVVPSKNAPGQAVLFHRAQDHHPPTRTVTAPTYRPESAAHSLSIASASGAITTPKVPLDSSNIRGGYVDNAFISAGPSDGHGVAWNAIGSADLDRRDSP